MTPATEKLIRERAEKATPGPWHADEGFGGQWVCTPGCERSFPVHPAPDPEKIPMPGVVLRTGAGADADFIAHARTDIPALLAALEAERADAENWRALMADVRTEAARSGRAVSLIEHVFALDAERQRADALPDNWLDEILLQYVNRPFGQAEAIECRDAIRAALEADR